MQTEFEPIVDKQESNLTEAVRNDAKADEFKNAMAEARNVRIQATEEKAGISDEVDSLINGRENLFNLFRFAMIALYPPAGLAFGAHQLFSNMKEGKLQIPLSHPAQSAFLDYKSKIDKVDGEIAKLATDYKEKSVIEQAAQNSESHISEKYEEFASQAETPVPSFPSLTANLLQFPMPTIPEKDADFIAKVIGLEGIDEQVQQYIFEQMNLSDIGDNTLTSLNARAYPNVAELDEEEFSFEPLSQREPLQRWPNLGLSGQPLRGLPLRGHQMRGPSSNEGLKKLGLFAALIALAYVAVRK